MRTQILVLLLQWNFQSIIISKSTSRSFVLYFNALEWRRYERLSLEVAGDRYVQLWFSFIDILKKSPYLTRCNSPRACKLRMTS